MNIKCTDLRQIWENVSRQCEYKQMMKECVNEEYYLYSQFKEPRYVSPFELINIFDNIVLKKYHIAILREEGSNSERECASAFYHAGFFVHDVTMTDLIEGKIKLNDFKGICFTGGFSFSDTLGSGRGWAQIIKRNKKLQKQFNRFYDRFDTFSIGICNGCQLMCELEWVPENVLKIYLVNLNLISTRVYKNNNIFLNGMED